jgi:hypothetical protein
MRSKKETILVKIINKLNRGKHQLKLIKSDDTPYDGNLNLIINNTNDYYTRKKIKKEKP